MAGALQAQVLLPFTHQQPDVPRPEEVLVYYSSDNRRGLWRYWDGGWQEPGQPAGYGGGGLLQTLAINRRFDWNAGGGNDRNGSVGVFNWGLGGRDFYVGVKTDTDGRYIDFDSSVGFNFSTASQDDGIPGTLAPANSGGQDIQAYPGSYPLSYGIWFKYKKANNNDSNVRQAIAGLAFGGNPPSGQVKLGFYFQDSDMKLRAVRRDSSGNFTVAKTFSYVFSENTLTCVVLTMTTGGNIKLYVDGSLEDSYTESNTIDDVGFWLGSLGTIGDDAAYTTGSWCGKWYKSCWWKIVLSSTEVNTFYDNGTKSPAGT